MSSNDKEPEEKLQPDPIAIRFKDLLRMTRPQLKERRVDCATCPVNMLCESGDGSAGYRCEKCGAVAVMIDDPNPARCQSVYIVLCSRNKFKVADPQNGQGGGLTPVCHVCDRRAAKHELRGFGDPLRVNEQTVPVGGHTKLDGEGNVIFVKGYESKLYWPGRKPPELVMPPSTQPIVSGTPPVLKKKRGKVEIVSPPVDTFMAIPPGTVGVPPAPPGAGIAVYVPPDHGPGECPHQPVPAPCPHHPHKHDDFPSVDPAHSMMTPVQQFIMTEYDNVSMDQRQEDANLGLEEWTKKLWEEREEEARQKK